MKRRIFLISGVAAAFGFGRTSTTSAALQAPIWVPRDNFGMLPAVFLDMANDRGWYGRTYASESELLAALSGGRSGTARTIGPVLRGSNVIYNGTFDTDTSGWNAFSGASIAWDGGELKVTNISGAAGAPIAWTNVVLDPKRAYQAGYTYVSGGAGNSRLLLFTANATKLRKAVIPPFSGIGSHVGRAAARPDNACLALRADNIRNNGSVNFDDVSLTEAVPFEPWNVGGYRLRVSARTPASISATQVLAVLDDDLTLAPNSGNTVRSGVRIEYSKDNHIHLTVTSAATQQCVLDLGTVGSDTSFTVEFRVGLSVISARLDDGPYYHAGMSNGAPGVAKLRIGTSATGQTWTGLITTLTIWALGERSIRFDGDSYISGAGGIGLPLFYSKVDDRIMTATGVGGADMPSIKDRILDPNNEELLSAITIFWDGSANGLTGVSTYCDMLQDCINALGHDRFIVIPPAIGTRFLKAKIRDEMVARWPSNVYDWRSDIPNSGGTINRSRFQGDGAHLNALGMNEAAAGLKAFMDAKGW